jgi:hypothetical protein
MIYSLVQIFHAGTGLQDECFSSLSGQYEGTAVRNKQKGEQFKAD